MKKQAVFREQALTNNPSSSYHSSPQQVRFQERAFVMGNVVGVNAYHLNRTALKQRFAEDGSHVHETALLSERECVSLVLSRVALAATQEAASQGCRLQPVCSRSL